MFDIHGRINGKELETIGKIAGAFELEELEHNETAALPHWIVRVRGGGGFRVFPSGVSQELETIDNSPETIEARREMFRGFGWSVSEAGR